jgi:hypothetical protein
MLQKTISTLFARMETQPVAFKPSEVIDAYRKVDRILDTAFLPEHVDTAERMFINLLNRFAFSAEHRTSPLVVGMQDRINTRRAEVIAQWEAMNGTRVAA